MSEPTQPATSVRQLEPGLLHWTVADDRIDWRSESYAIEAAEGWVWVDPLPLSPAALAVAVPPIAICLTGGFHQRSAWRYRRRFGVPIHAPRGAAGLLEPADESYEGETILPGGLRGFPKPGPTLPHYVFEWRTPGGRIVLFCADLLMRADDGPFAFVPQEHQDDPAATRASVRSLLARPPIDLLCPAHGAPVTEGGAAVLREALDRDSG